MRRTTLVAVIGLVAMLTPAVAHRASACGCCACDFGGGDIECGEGDTDCGVCINIGGVPAMDCSACTTPQCGSNTFCVGHETGMCGGVAVSAPAPTLTPWGLLTLALLLVSGGVWTIRRRRT